MIYVKGKEHRMEKIKILFFYGFMFYCCVQRLLTLRLNRALRAAGVRSQTYAVSGKMAVLSNYSVNFTGLAGIGEFLVSA
jgi:hypothetical protein